MNAIHKLAEYFAQFPGIGQRQSKRFVYFLLNQNNGFLEDLAKRIKELRNAIRLCESCYRFYEDDHSDSSFCNMCASKNRKQATLLVVEKDADLETVEKTDLYRGFYFVLGGTVPILEKEPEKRVRLRELANTVKKRTASGVLKEIILALSLNPEGENTIEHVRRVLMPIVKKHGIKISTLGRGLSTGTELEYSDSDTIKNALQNRA